MKLYNLLYNYKVYTGDYNLFMKEYYPTVNKKIDDQILELKNKKLKYDNINFSKIPYTNRKIEILGWFIIFYLFRFLYLGYKKSRKIMKLH